MSINTSSLASTDSAFAPPVSGSAPVSLASGMSDLNFANTAADWIPPGETLSFKEFAAFQASQQPIVAENPPRKVRSTTTPAYPFKVTRMSQIAPQSVQWLWPSRVALGKLTLFIGDPSASKSLLSLVMAANVSLGRAWPDGTPCPQGEAVVISAEDGVADTVRPRLDVAGADQDRIHSIGDFRIDAQHLEALEHLVESREGAIKLIVIDPISAFLYGADSHVNTEVRQVLEPLARLAEKHGAAVVAITHLTKSSTQKAIHRAIGSIAFVAAARAAYLVAKDSKDPSKRYMLPVKNNLGNDRSGLAYSVVSVPDPLNSAETLPKIVWQDGEETITADEALAALEPAAGAGRITAEDKAAEWLLAQLANGPMLSADLNAKATEAQIGAGTLSRAKGKLGITAEKRPDGWYVTPPAS